MPWIVDTCLLLDIALPNPAFGEAAAQLLASKRSDGLVICPVTYIELAPFFKGQTSDAHQFLAGVEVTWSEPWTEADTGAAFVGWSDYVTRRKLRKLPRRPLADALIGAFALRFDGLLTRNPADFRSVFPHLTIIEP